MVTHDPVLAERADRIVRMADGQMDTRKIDTGKILA
jgi:putative ABC transport system ATP-binding protein